LSQNNRLSRGRNYMIVARAAGTGANAP